MPKLYQTKRVPYVFKAIGVFGFTFFTSSLLKLSYAQGETGEPEEPFDDLLIDFGDLFALARNLILPIAVGLGLFLIIINGYKLLTSEGDPQKVQDGKEGLTSAIIGTIFVLLAGTLLRAILTGLLGVDSG